MAPASRAPLQAAVLTPSGRGAVAVVRIWGEGATEAVARSFHWATGRTLAEASLGRILFGRWLPPAAAAPAQVTAPVPQAPPAPVSVTAPALASPPAPVGEELVVCRRAQDDWEIHCHGGSAAVAAVLEALTAAGCATVPWQTFARAAEPDTIALEAREQLAAARTARTAGILLDQLAGALRRNLSHIIALVRAGEQSAALAGLRELLAYRTLAMHLTVPLRVVLAGLPNVGKSSLLNALLGYERAIVFDRPGTTRDVVTASAAFDGWPVELSDTAGLRESTDPLETAGIDAARRRGAEADLTLLVFDLTQPWTPAETRLAAEHPEALLVHNQADRAPTAATGNSAVSERPAGLCTSALARTGLDELIRAIVARLVPKPPEPGAAVPFTARQLAHLDAALAQLTRGNAPAALAALEQI